MLKKNKCKSIAKQYNLVRKKRLKQWDKYFGTHPLSAKWHPEAKRGTNLPKDRKILMSLIEKQERLKTRYEKEC